MRRSFFVLTLLVLGLAPSGADASRFGFVSDLISTSQASVSAAHTITFRTVSAIPPSGTIVITPENTAFSIPMGFDHTDMDLAVSSGGPYAQRDLAAAANAANDGVAVVSGSSSSITITLNSSSGIGAGEDVRIDLGSTASHQGGADLSPVNAGSYGSYRIRIVSYDFGSTEIDFGTAMIALVAPVTLSAAINAIPPVRFNGFPIGAIAAGNSTIEVSLETDKIATCRYATSSGVVYSSMTGSFSTYGGQLFTYVTNGYTDGQSYNFYVRCADVYNTMNTDDYLIAFTLGPTPLTDTSVGDGAGTEGGVNGRGGTGDIRNGSGLLYRASVDLSGWAMPLSTVNILRDGVQEVAAIAQADGSFSASVNGLERGSYTFLAYAVDSAGRISAPFTSTLTFGSGSHNSIESIVIPPTIALEKSVVQAGDKVHVFGGSIPGSSVEVAFTNQSSTATLGSSKRYLATVSKGAAGIPDGTWDVTFDVQELAKGTYNVRAKTTLPSGAISGFSKLVTLSVGTVATENLSNRADINRDGKVNLVDFSILLSNWGTDDEDADINQDGNINLADFSILLFNWTG